MIKADKDYGHYQYFNIATFRFGLFGRWFVLYFYPDKNIGYKFSKMNPRWKWYKKIICITYDTF